MKHMKRIKIAAALAVLALTLLFLSGCAFPKNRLKVPPSANSSVSYDYNNF